MAHTGKFYELHFRRDLSINLRNNNLGYPKRFSVGAFGLFGTIGAYCVNNLITVTAVQETTYQLLRWESNVIATGGRLFKLVIDTTVAKGYYQFAGQVEAHDLVAGQLCSAPCPQIAGDDYAFLEGSPFGHPLPNPVLFGSNSNGTFQCRAVLW